MVEDDEPVFYCRNCLGLAILRYDNSTDYCGKCGCTDIGVSHFNDWEELYKIKYGKPLINKKQEKWKRL